MNDYDVSPSEMRRFSKLGDSDLDALRKGCAPDDDTSLEGIARFVRDLGETFPEPSTADLEQVHVAAMMKVARLTADNGEPVAIPASKVHGPGAQASGLPKPWREATMLKIRTMFAKRAAKVAATTIIILFAFSGAAFAGVLPSPVQNSVADGASVIGIDLPGGSHDVYHGAGPGAPNGIGQTDTTAADGTSPDEVDCTDTHTTGATSTDDVDCTDDHATNATSLDEVDCTDTHTTGATSTDDVDCTDNDTTAPGVTTSVHADSDTTTDTTDIHDRDPGVDESDTEPTDKPAGNDQRD